MTDIDRPLVLWVREWAAPFSCLGEHTEIVTALWLFGWAHWDSGSPLAVWVKSLRQWQPFSCLGEHTETVTALQLFGWEHWDSDSPLAVWVSTLRQWQPFSCLDEHTETVTALWLFGWACGNSLTFQVACLFSEHWFGCLDQKAAPLSLLNVWDWWRQPFGRLRQVETALLTVWVR